MMALRALVPTWVGQHHGRTKDTQHHMAMAAIKAHGAAVDRHRMVAAAVAAAADRQRMAQRRTATLVEAVGAEASMVNMPIVLPQIIGSSAIRGIKHGTVCIGWRFGVTYKTVMAS